MPWCEFEHVSHLDSVSILDVLTWHVTVYRSYLFDLIPYAPSRLLSSISANILTVPWTKLVFSCRALRVWNFVENTNSQTFSTFKRHLKTLFFQWAFNITSLQGPQCTLIICWLWHYISWLLTYLGCNVSGCWTFSHSSLFILMQHKLLTVCCHYLLVKFNRYSVWLLVINVSWYLSLDNVSDLI